MKLAIIGSRGFPSTYGGYETLVRHLAPRWVDQGHEVTVYCRQRSQLGRVAFVDGVRCIWTPGLDSKSWSTLSFGASSHVDAAVRGYDAALVLNVANGFYLPLLKARGVPAVVNTDGIEWERGKWGKAAQRVFYSGAALTARQADVLVADSQAIARIWQRLFDVSPRFIPYGAPVLDEAQDDRVRSLGLTPQTYALVVARLIPENNVELTLDALDLLDGSRPPAVIVGSANYASPLEERLRALDSGGRLKWLGHVHDQELLTQLWANCGVYVHGHSVGGTNPALLQALGAGAPTLALNTEFNQEVLERDEQMFPPDAKALAQKLVTILGDPNIRNRFVEHGRTVVAERYAWADVSRSYMAALEDARDLARRAEDWAGSTAKEL
ncbi:MAG TPA: glycosyltransferase [Solirubrobacteraceae bacterium]